MREVTSVSRFLQDLEADAAVQFSGGRSNNLWDVGLTIAAILTSLVAAMVASTDVHRWIRVGIAAVPAGCTSIQKVVEVKARSNWYFNYAAHLRALATTVESSANPDLEEFAKIRAKIMVDMEDSWSRIGRGGSKPVSKADRH